MSVSGLADLMPTMTGQNGQQQSSDPWATHWIGSWREMRHVGASGWRARPGGRAQRRQRGSLDPPGWKRPRRSRRER